MSRWKAIKLNSFIGSTCAASCRMSVWLRTATKVVQKTKGSCHSWISPTGFLRFMSPINITSTIGWMTFMFYWVNDLEQAGDSPALQTDSYRSCGSCGASCGIRLFSYLKKIQVVQFCLLLLALSSFWNEVPVKRHLKKDPPGQPTPTHRKNTHNLPTKMGKLIIDNLGKLIVGRDPVSTTLIPRIFL